MLCCGRGSGWLQSHLQTAVWYPVNGDFLSEIDCFWAIEVLISGAVVDHVAARRTAAQGSYHLLRDVRVVEQQGGSGMPVCPQEARDVGPRQYHREAAKVPQRAQY